MQKRRRIGAEGGDEEEADDNAGHQQEDDGEDREMEYEPTDPGTPVATDNEETENVEKDVAKDDAEQVVVNSMDDSELLCHLCGDIRTPGF